MVIVLHPSLPSVVATEYELITASSSSDVFDLVTTALPLLGVPPIVGSYLNLIVKACEVTICFAI